MELEEIQRNNALIAEFMGLNFRRGQYTGYKYWYSPSQVCVAKKDGLSYHWDWNRLIPVVEKIESMDFRVDIFYRYTQILTLDDYPICRSLANRSDKKSGVYEAVVKFIEHHNEEKEHED